MQVVDWHRRADTANIDYSTMKSFCIFGAVVLLSLVELEAATSVSQISSPTRNLTVTVDNHLTLYFDGIEITNLPNADSYNRPDTVDFPCTTKSIAIYGRNSNPGGPAGIVASTNDDYVLTNSSWKCSNVNESRWEEIDFDDSAWPSAIEFGRNGNNSWKLMPGISSSAVWIWTADNYNRDLDAFCRINLDYIDPCDPNPCLNSGICNNLGCDSFTCTCPIYATGAKCESPNYDETNVCGTALKWSEHNATNGFTRLCHFWPRVNDTEGRFTTCRNIIKGLPLFGNYTGLLNAGGNFGCVVSQRFPEDIPQTSYLSCSDNFQQDVYLGNVSETDRLMVCIRYPYVGLPDGKQH